MTLTWRRADDAEAVHALLLLSDQQAATMSRTPVPRRSRETTAHLVATGATYVGRDGDEVLATFSVSATPTFDPDEHGLPAVTGAWYERRLAVHPAAPSLVGLQAVRTAIEVARDGGAEVLRAEANPDLSGVLRLLTMSGYVVLATDPDGPTRRAFLQRDLRQPHAHEPSSGTTGRTAAP
jgi:hypothetical protein